MTPRRAPPAARLLGALALLGPAAPLQADVAAEPLATLSADLDQPSAVTVDESGRAYVLDGLNGRVVVFDADGRVVRHFGRSGDGDGELDTPTDLTLDADTVVVADSGNGRLALFSREGRYLGARPLPGAERAAEPVGVTVWDGELAWSDRASHRVCVRALAPDAADACFGGPGDAEGRFHNPFMLAADAGYLYVVDVLNGRVQVMNRRGRPYGTVGMFGAGPGELIRPNGIAVDDTGRLFIGDAVAGTVSVFTQRRYRGRLVDASGAPLRFAAPVGLAAWRDRLYVVDMAGNGVRVFRLGGETDAARISHGTPGTSRRDCATCHIGWLEGPAPAGADPDVPAAGAAHVCYSCHHGAVVESRRAIGRGAQHPSHEQPRPDTPAGPAAERDEALPDHTPLIDQRELYCGSCHTPHRDEARHGRRIGPWMRQIADDDPSPCRACHASRADAGDIAPDEPPANHPIGVRMQPPPAPDAPDYAATTELQQGLPAHLAEHGARAGADERMACTGCHRAHGGVGDALTVVTEQRLCRTCHEHAYAPDETAARRQGVHPTGIRLEEPIHLGDRTVEAIECLTCHRAHDAEAPYLLREEPDALCRGCHERQHARGRDEAARRGIHPSDLALDEPVRVAGREVQRLTCLTCHSVHGGIAGTPSLVAEHRDGELCAACHEAQRAVAGTDHDLRLSAQDGINALEESPAQAGACGSCHSLHRADGGTPHLFVGAPLDGAQPDGALPRDAACFACHRDGGLAADKPIEHFTHPHQDLVLRSDPQTLPLVGADGAIAGAGRIACITCHEPHRWHPGNDGHDTAGTENREGTASDSFLRRSEARGTFCVLCHGPAARIKHKYYHDDEARRLEIEYLN